MIGLATGFAVWTYTLLLPGLLSDLPGWQTLARDGPFGITMLRPHALFGLPGDDPLIHAVFWSLGLNTLGFIFGSLSRIPSPLEALQSRLFVDVFRAQDTPEATAPETASPDALFDLAQRVMGPDRAYAIFRDYANRTNAGTEFPVANGAFVDHLEKRMAASVGAASARAMILGVTGSERIGIDALMDIADEAARLMRHSTEVERESDEIRDFAKRLSAANDRLRALDRQKDEFLSQVSHELRTPMTSIRSFTEILTTTPDLDPEERMRFVRIIHGESIRLTQLLDEILDMGVVERNADAAENAPIDPEEALDQALGSCLGLMRSAGVQLHEERTTEKVRVHANAARLSQVFINIISNGIKYNANKNPIIWLKTQVNNERFVVTIEDNGNGIPDSERERIFDKFARGSTAQGAQGAGLGLAISRAILARVGGTVTLLPQGEHGARFEISLPVSNA